MTKGTEYWNAVSREWQDGHANSLWRAHCDAIHRDLIARWLPICSSGRLLKTDLFDEAAGEGLHSDLALRARWVVGVDLSTETGGRVRSRQTDLRVVGADVRHLPFETGAFDVVVSNSTLDHFSSREEVLESLREIRRVMRAAGRLLLTLDNLRNPVVALRQMLPFRLLNRLGLVPYQVGATYGPTGLRRALTEVNFQVDRMAALMHCPRAPAVAVARLLEAQGSPATRERYLRFLTAFERLSNWPTRYVTGYFVAVGATKG